MKRAPLRGVRKMAVLQPGALDDFMFCLPALHALKHSYPEAQLVYLGLPWHARFLAGRAGPVHRVLPAPDMAATGAPAEALVDAMRRASFDLVLQMHDGGRHANPLVRRFEARLAVGLRSADAAPLDRWLAHGAPVNRRLQLLEVAALAGATAWPMDAGLHVTGADRLLAAQLLPPASGQRLALIHPGAAEARQRWPPARFAAVADALVEEGATVAIHGAAADAPLTRAVLGAMRHQAIDLAGKASLPALCGLLARCELVVANDSGALHMALALGKPCVGIYGAASLLASAPLCQQGHRAAASLRMACPVCGAGHAAASCPHPASLVDDVALAEVTALAIDLFRAA